MTSEEFKTRREILSMTQQRLADVLGLSRRIIQYYEAGAEVPRTVELAMDAVELTHKLGE